MSDDDRALMERLATLEAEVKADADAQRARKEAALQKVREQRAKDAAEKAALSTRQAEIHSRKKRTTGRVEEDVSDDAPADSEGFGGALQLAKKANDVKNELAKKGEKSWVKSGIASTLLGPLGWLYAGSFREAVPASAAYLLFAALAAKLPIFLLWPVMMIALPLSGIAGVVYALQYNKKGSRQRLWGGDKKKKKQLPPGK